MSGFGQTCQSLVEALVGHMQIPESQQEFISAYPGLGWFMTHSGIDFSVRAGPRRSRPVQEPHAPLTLQKSGWFQVSALVIPCRRTASQTPLKGGRDWR
jgi:hypothetical protein